MLEKLDLTKKMEKKSIRRKWSIWRKIWESCREDARS